MEDGENIGGEDESSLLVVVVSVDDSAVLHCCCCCIINVRCNVCEREGCSGVAFAVMKPLTVGIRQIMPTRNGICLDMEGDVESWLRSPIGECVTAFRCTSGVCK